MRCPRPTSGWAPSRQRHPAMVRKRAGLTIPNPRRVRGTGRSGGRQGLPAPPTDWLRISIARLGIQHFEEGRATEALERLGVSAGLARIGGPFQVVQPVPRAGVSGERRSDLLEGEEHRSVETGKAGVGSGTRLLDLRAYCLPVRERPGMRGPRLKPNEDGASASFRARRPAEADLRVELGFLDTDRGRGCSKVALGHPDVRPPLHQHRAVAHRDRGREGGYCDVMANRSDREQGQPSGRARTRTYRPSTSRLFHELRPCYRRFWRSKNR
jgi:hypothetical protein